MSLLISNKRMSETKDSIDGHPTVLKKTYICNKGKKLDKHKEIKENR